MALVIDAMTRVNESMTVVIDALASAKAEQLAEKTRSEVRNIPQRLKPRSFCGGYGPTEVGPLQRIEFFREL